MQVAPAELEAILLNHPNIKDVGVVGVPDEEVGELPLAFVVKDPQSNLTEDDIIKYVAGIIRNNTYLLTIDLAKLWVC
jgi:4-coumarate--CoA ligase